MSAAALALSLAACGGSGAGDPTVFHALTVERRGGGSGTVTGGGGAISCGAACSASFGAGTPVTLTASPDAGSTFASWAGCDSATGTTCNVTMNASRTVTATFEPVQHTLSVQKLGSGTGTVTGGGISCGATCSASLAHGTPVTLTASAGAGSTFASWTGCDSTSGMSCTVTMLVDRIVTATFNPVQYTLTVQKSGAGSGTVTGGGGAISCGAACSASFAAGTPATLTASPDASSTFASWAGCDSTTGTSCTVTMTANRIVTAMFDPARGSLQIVNSTSYTINELYASPAGAGTWGPNQLTSSIAAGATFTLAGVPVGTYDFRAVASDGVTTWQTASVAITAGGQVTWTLLPPGVGSLSVANGTSYTIAELYVSPAGAGAWGANQLAPQTILPGGTFTLVHVPVGAYDFRAVGTDGISYWQTNAVAITAGGLVTWTLQQPLVGSLAVVNNHCVPFDQLYVRPAGSPSWSANQLAAPVAAGATFTLTNLPVGTYDVNAATADGTTWLVSGIPITDGGTYSWTLFMPAGTGCLAVVNNTGGTIDFVWAPLSPQGCTSRLWGNELLQGTQIPPNTTLTIGNLPQGAHDLWARDATQQTDYQLCGMGIPAGGKFDWYLIPP